MVFSFSSLFFNIIFIAYVNDMGCCLRLNGHKLTIFAILFFCFTINERTPKRIGGAKMKSNKDKNLPTRIISGF